MIYPYLKYATLGVSSSHSTVMIQRVGALKAAINKQASKATNLMKYFKKIQCFSENGKKKTRKYYNMNCP